MASFITEIQDIVNNSKIFEILELKTGVKRIYLFRGFVFLLVTYLIFGFAAQLVCNLIGFLYPAYASMKAIETPQKGDDTKWLTYWTVFAFFSVVEFAPDLLLSWFPFYWLIKCLFMVWLFLPGGSNGSLILYETVVRKFFLKYTKDVDDVVSGITQMVYCLSALLSLYSLLFLSKDVKEKFILPSN